MSHPSLVTCREKELVAQALMKEFGSYDPNTLMFDGRDEKRFTTTTSFSITIGNVFTIIIIQTDHETDASEILDMESIVL